MLNESKLYDWLRLKKENINAALFLNLLEKTPTFSYINIQKKNKVYPYLLVEIVNSSNKELKLLKETLENELKNKNNQFWYLKYKLNMFIGDITNKKTFNVNSYIHYECLHKNLQIDDLYHLLFIVINFQLSLSEKEILSQILSPLIINNSKNYNLIEASILVQIACHIPCFFPKEFFEDIKEFFENQQKDEGYFGYSDPFISKHTLNDNDKILISFYCYQALKKLYSLR